MQFVADLLMPKLGLTMTEGTVAQWAVALGATFGADDLVAVIETDKIAYEVKAPGPGRLTKVLVPNGMTVPVGTPIAQWELKDVQPRDVALAATVAEPATVPAPPNHTASPVSAADDSQRSRIIATPYARRLARNAGIELTDVTASNSRRIRAIDVERAVVRRAAATASAPQPERAAAAEFILLGADISSDRLLTVIADLTAARPDLQPDPLHFVVLAAARAMTAQGMAPLIGLQRNASAPHLIATEACRSLSTIIAAERSGVSDGFMTLLIIDHAGATRIARTPSHVCCATLGVGAIKRLFRPDVGGAPVLRAEMHLSFVRRDDTALPRDLFDRICHLLENPFVLLAM